MAVFSDPCYLQVVRAALEKYCHIAGLDETTSGQIILAVDEAMTNIIRHAYDGASDKMIEIEMLSIEQQDHRAIQIRLRDYGRQVDPALIRSRDLCEIRPGGLGVHIMHKCMDMVEYSPAQGGGTLLTMSKRICREGKE